jgi:CheY-like chemotaxis protein
MLAYAGKGQFTPSAVDVSRVLRGMMPLLRSTVPENIDIELELSERLPSIQADPTQIEQVAMNLILNSAESIAGSGIIHVRTRMEEAAQPGNENRWDVGEPQPGKYVVLEVQDSGCGIDPAVRGKIFEPFFTTKFPGRGLGLAAVAGIVRSLDGALRLESKPGEGATATALFPSSAAAHAQSTASHDPILIVDDDQTVRDTAMEVLREHGYGVLRARNGREAAALVRERKGRISAVLLNMSAPAIDGREALRELKKLQPDLRIIIVTGQREQDGVQTFGGLGVAWFLEKPYTPQRLLEVVQTTLQD